MAQFNFWDTEVTYLKKVGPKRAEVLKSECNIRTYGDLLHFYPRKYIDKSHISKVIEIRNDTLHVSLIGKILSFDLVKGKYGNRLVAKFDDGSGQIDLVWFKGARWIRETYKEGDKVAIFGQPKFYGRKPQIAHPEMDKLRPDQTTPNNLKIVPYYPSTDKLKKAGLDARGFRTLTETLLEIGDQDLRENLPEFIRKKYKLISRKEALHEIHFPTSFPKLELAKYRLVFEEFFFFQLLLAQKRVVQQPKRKSFSFPIVGDYFNTFYQEHLPFELTGAQKRVLKEIRVDLAKNYQMNRLVQGDVGCGKTMVAFMTMLIALDNGYQAAMMAPTEILAEQHYNNFRKYADPLGIKVALLVGGQKKSERKLILESLVSGYTQIVVGTHALIEDKVKFRNLALSVVDEQHKFGVLQRAKLWKGAAGYPHSMVMTATPIPRTLGMTMYGDLEVSVIDELPPGRTPVKTAVRAEAQRLEVFGFIRTQIEAGRQCYIVYPLVEESQKLDYLAVKEGYEAVSRAFPNLHIGIVHGRMKAEDKEFEMQRFKKGETHILVATTVIEVGVDVPNATIMVIENSEKFGLSQLHQLRGRVGRGGNQSYCILMTGKKVSEDAKKRLKAMVSTTDGFKIAEFDLRLRGPGDFAGTRQSGMPEFKIANIVEDQMALQVAREAAFAIMEHDPELTSPENLILKDYFNQYHRHHKWISGIA